MACRVAHSRQLAAVLKVSRAGFTSIRARETAPHGCPTSRSGSTSASTLKPFAPSSRDSRDRPTTQSDRMPPQLNNEGPTRGKDLSRMAHGKRQYGSVLLLKNGKGWVIRWRELEIAPNGTSKRVLRYERLDPMSRREAAATLARKVAAASGRQHRYGRVSRSRQSRPNGKRRCC